MKKKNDWLFVENEWFWWNSDLFSNEWNLLKTYFIADFIEAFYFIKPMGEAKSKYDIFCKERDEMIHYYDKNKRI